MLSPVAEGDNMVAVPAFANQYKTATTMTTATSAAKNPHANPVRNAVIVGSPNPLIH